MRCLFQEVLKHPGCFSDVAPFPRSPHGSRQLFQLQPSRPHFSQQAKGNEGGAHVLSIWGDFLEVTYSTSAYILLAEHRLYLMNCVRTKKQKRLFVSSKALCHKGDFVKFWFQFYINMYTYTDQQSKYILIVGLNFFNFEN